MQSFFRLGGDQSFENRFEAVRQVSQTHVRKLVQSLVWFAQLQPPR